LFGGLRAQKPPRGHGTAFTPTSGTKWPTATNNFYLFFRNAETAARQGGSRSVEGNENFKKQNNLCQLSVQEPC